MSIRSTLLLRRTSLPTPFRPAATTSGRPAWLSKSSGSLAESASTLPSLPMRLMAHPTVVRSSVLCQNFDAALQVGAWHPTDDDQNEPGAGEQVGLDLLPFALFDVPVQHQPEQADGQQ